MSFSAVAEIEKVADASSPSLDSEHSAPCSPSCCKVAYVMSRFPKLTETFVLYEMQAIERHGVEIEVFPLIGSLPTGEEIAGTSIWQKARDHWAAPIQPRKMHAEAIPYVSKAHYAPFFNLPILKATLGVVARRPIRFMQTLARVVWWNRRNLNFLLGGLAIFCKCAYFAKQMKEEQVEHIHAHFCNHPAMAAYIIHQFTGIPYSFTAHGSDLHRSQDMLLQKVNDAAFVAAISTYNRELIIQHCGEHVADKVHTLHCGVDLAEFHPAESARPNSDSLQVFCVGTLHEVKGQSYLIRALDLLIKRGVNAHVHFVGDGPDGVSLISIVQAHSLQQHVTFHGTKTHAELVELLRAADVLVAPSVPSSDGRREGIPVVLMEAMASGLPVVASRLSGIPELINSDDIGILVEPKDVAGIADALSRLADDQALRLQMGHKGRQRVRASFNLSRNAETLVDLFHASRANCDHSLS